jgi:hypothetical protein
LLIAAVASWAYIAHIDDLSYLVPARLDTVGATVLEGHFQKVARGLNAALARLGEERDLVSGLLVSRTGDARVATALVQATDALRAEVDGGMPPRDTAALAQLVGDAISAATVARATWIDVAVAGA